MPDAPAAQPAVITSSAQFPTVESTPEAPASPAPQTVLGPKVDEQKSGPKAASTPAQSSTGLSSEQLNEKARGSLVNILCTTRAGGSFKPISGSGVLVDSRGVILTNAHVAQFLLLRDYGSPGNVDCVVRMGSPARAAYRATLLYLPPAWIEQNASQITSTQATGTGEGDFAFLFITGTTNPTTPLPTEFPHLPLSIASPDVGDSMLLASYPAGFLSGELTATSLYASSAFAHVTQLFSYSSEQTRLAVDLFSIGGTIVSQSGSSGGAAVRTDGTLAGVIVTATLAETTGQRDLRALSVGYIDRALAASGKGGITGLLTGELATKAADFNAADASAERAKLEAILNKQ